MLTSSQVKDRSILLYMCQHFHSEGSTPPSSKHAAQKHDSIGAER